MCRVMRSSETGLRARGPATSLMPWVVSAFLGGPGERGGSATGGSGRARARKGLGMLRHLELLRGGLVRGVDLQGAGELVDRSGDVSALAHDASAVDVGCGGLPAHAVDARGVAHVRGFLLVGVEVGLVGGVVVS